MKPSSYQPHADYPPPLPNDHPPDQPGLAASHLPPLPSYHPTYLPPSSIPAPALQTQPYPLSTASAFPKNTATTGSSASLARDAHHHHQLPRESFTPHQPNPPSQSEKKSNSFRYKTYQTAFGPLSLNQFLRKDWIKYYIIIIILLILIGLLAIFHHQIVIFLHPYVQSMRNIKVKGVEIGWIIPILILFIISFPPLFGHEVVIILCGLVWGLWSGFIIVCIGTLLGELANYWAFKYACSHRAYKLEKKVKNYACMCIVIREGGFWIAFLARLSAIPGHLVTPIFATTGMSLTTFTLATVLSMPKQLAGVYLGTLFSEDGDGLPKSTSSSIVKYSVLAFSFIVTVVAALYIYKKVAEVRIRLDHQNQDPQFSPDLDPSNNFHARHSSPTPILSRSDPSIHPDELRQFGPYGSNLYHGIEQLPSPTENGRQGDGIFGNREQALRRQLMYNLNSRGEVDEEEMEMEMDGGRGRLGQFGNNLKGIRDPFSDPMTMVRSTRSESLLLEREGQGTEAEVKENNHLASQYSALESPDRHYEYDHENPFLDASPPILHHISSHPHTLIDQPPAYH